MDDYIESLSEMLLAARRAWRSAKDMDDNVPFPTAEALATTAVRLHELYVSYQIQREISEEDSCALLRE